MYRISATLLFMIISLIVYAILTLLILDSLLNITIPSFLVSLLCLTLVVLNFVISFSESRGKLIIEPRFKSIKEAPKICKILITLASIGVLPVFTFLFYDVVIHRLDV